MQNGIDDHVKRESLLGLIVLAYKYKNVCKHKISEKDIIDSLKTGLEFQWSTFSLYGYKTKLSSILVSGNSFLITCEWV